jgi:hypothetical protein
LGYLKNLGRETERSVYDFHDFVAHRHSVSAFGPFSVNGTKFGGISSSGEG